MTDAFSAIREELALPDVLERYGVTIERGNMAKCPFHDDRHPSAKIYPQRLHCFACSKSWDAVAFVGELFHLTPIDAARKLSDDFGLGLFETQLSAVERQRIEKDRELVRAFKEWWERARIAALWYENYLKAQFERSRPRNRSDGMSDYFCRIVQEQTRLERLLWLLEEGEAVSAIEHVRRTESTAAGKTG